MSDVTIAAAIFCFFALIVAGLQMALALGAPLGELAMGGKIKGRFPIKLRIAAVIQLLLVLVSVAIVLSRAKLVFVEYFALSRSLIWFVVGLFALSTALNLITSSKKERLLGVPVAVSLFFSSGYVALS